MTYDNLSVTKTVTTMLGLPTSIQSRRVDLRNEKVIHTDENMKIWNLTCKRLMHLLVASIDEDQIAANLVKNGPLRAVAGIM